MSEYLLDIDVVLEADDEERPTLEMPEEKLRVLVAKSIPPVTISQKEDRISVPFVLATPWEGRR